MTRPCCDAVADWERQAGLAPAMRYCNSQIIAKRPPEICGGPGNLSGPAEFVSDYASESGLQGFLLVVHVAS